MAHTTLIDVDTLGARLGDPQLAIVDCRFDLADPAWGDRVYAEGHVPGAVYAHIDRDLTGPKSGANGRHPLPSPEALAATFGALGIGNGVQVVAYDQDFGMFASRLWWLLRWLGHDEVAVLDGGWAAWTASNGAVARGAESRAPRTFSGRPRTGMTAAAGDVAACAGDRRTMVVDARAPERYRGDREPIDPVAGHIPGAVNFFFQQNLANGRFAPVDELRSRWRERLGDVAPEQVICYCGSGVTACHDILALEHAELPGARLYPGSWSEWVADPTRPVERG
jgi:thiosulfate/3-mercaptopyruvate sulfurtransferase